MLPVAAMFLFACSPERGSGNVAANEGQVPSAVPVRTTRASLLAEPERLHFAGIARNRQRAVVTFQVGGVIHERLVEIGDHVSRSDILARLYNPQLQPQLDSARHRVQQLSVEHGQALRDLDRIQQLYGQDVASLQEVEQQASRAAALQAAIADAGAAVQQATQLLEESALRAPFDGTINAILLDTGEFAQPGQGVLQISGPDTLEVEVPVPGTLLTAYSPGDTVIVRDPLRDRPLTGTVRELGRSSEGTLYPLIVSIIDPATRPGDALEIVLTRQTPPQLVIPLTAVMRTADGLAVFTVTHSAESDMGIATRIPIDISRLQGEHVVLRDPGNGQIQLRDGDEIVYAGLTRLTDGDTVRVLP